ncbi:zinc-binding alcohol dehydrogenase family protein [Convivina intestini]|uniref:Zinc-type alcohol dehydrogenase-like protein n=1 Tax=Convivina intestini TaxID=1505726 RepID=A0A2U1DF39_9LACO|nr:zinc-binding alcohol dehydrogenase family protein [Convivina intestini]PVY86288.1 zinc-binding alcohol dehydrogenase family protein [Convivina intestini]CAH1851027.1 Zinc-type alcohol dehydrogenase-like protein [Convivina intestini]SDB82200.1 NADPH2:quinone reductase [Leuconostocaceae bacterium R-53105]
MTKIQAVGFYQHLPISNENSFQDISIDEPTLKPHDLLVAVDGVSVNPVDTYVRKSGRATSLAHPKVIGWDAVGRVLAVGEQVKLFKIGDRVWYAGDFKRSGSDSQQQVVDERIVGFAPESLNDQQAAAIPLVGLTAYESLFEQLKVGWNNHNQTILIINGAGGVGSMAVQLAKLAGLKVIATASRPDSIAWVKKLGADQVVDHHQNLVNQIRTKEMPYVDYILNLNNLDAHWHEIAELIKPDGHVAATTENHRLIDLQKLTKKRVTFAWEWMYSKSYYQLDSMISQHEILNHLAQLYDQEKLVSIQTKHYQPINAANLRKAHADVETGKMIGKVTLTGWDKH